MSKFKAFSAEIQLAWFFLESGRNPLRHLVPHCLVSVQYRLLVDDDLCRVGFRSADS